jgi:uncharacterized SAM-binding protein YcdF (DUF218 family)
MKQMAWLLKNAFAGLLLFPCNFLLVGLFAWLLRRRFHRFSTALLGVSFAGLWLLSTPGISVPLAGLIESHVSPLKLDEPGLASRAQAIVVLGGGRALGVREYGGRALVSSQGFSRLRYAAELQRRTQAPILTTGGAPGQPGTSEAQLMADELRHSLGCKTEWVEGRSANTAENARFSYELLAPLGIKRIFLVTHATHMVRALPTFERAGFEVVPAPMGFLGDGPRAGTLLGWIPSPAGAEASSIYFHEVIGALWYRLTGAY